VSLARQGTKSWPNGDNKLANTSEHVSKVIWQEAASPLSARVSECIHPPRALGTQRAHAKVGFNRSEYFSPQKCPLLWGSGPHLTNGSLNPHASAPKWHLVRFSHFLHSSPVCTTHRHTDHATCGIYSNRQGDVVEKESGDTLVAQGNAQE